jgi:DNA polymerase-1
MFAIPIENVTKEQRFIAKTINFGLAYGMGSNKLRDILNAEAERNGTAKYGPQQTKNLVAKYRSAYRRVIDWLDDAGAMAIRKGYSETMYGRKRFFIRPAQGISEEDFEQQMSGIRRQGANAPIQGTNADITKLAMLDIHRELRNNGFSADIIIQVHDEIVVLSRKDEASAVKEVVVASMIEAAQKVISK